MLKTLLLGVVAVGFSSGVSAVEVQVTNLLTADKYFVLNVGTSAPEFLVKARSSVVVRVPSGSATMHRYSVDVDGFIFESSSDATYNAESVSLGTLTSSVALMVNAEAVNPVEYQPVGDIALLLLCLVGGFMMGWVFLSPLEV